MIACILRFRAEFGTRRLLIELIGGPIVAVLIGALLIGFAAVTHEPPAAVAAPSPPAPATDGADRGQAT